jgi:hypothetical protein
MCANAPTRVYFAGTRAHALAIAPTDRIRTTHEKHDSQGSPLAAVLFIATTLGCASTATHEGTGEYVDDTVITTKVKAAILNEPSLKSAEINVETFKGVVQLSGFVSTPANQTDGRRRRAPRGRRQVGQERHAPEVAARAATRRGL